MKYDAIEYMLDGNWFSDYGQSMRDNERQIDAHIFWKKSIECYEKGLALLSKTKMSDTDKNFGLRMQNRLYHSKNIESVLYKYLVDKAKTTEPKEDAVSQYNHNFLCGYVCAEQMDRFDTVDKELEWLGYAIDFYSTAVDIYNNASDSEKFAIREKSLSLEPAENFLYASQAKFKCLDAYLESQAGDNGFESK